MADDEILEEEVSYVMLDFGGILEGEFENKVTKPCKILGLDTESPYLDIGGSVFKGEFEDTPDTYVFFEADGTKVANDDGSSFDHMRYVCHTTKKLNLAHSLIRKKDEEKVNKDVPQTAPLTDFAIHATERGQDAFQLPDQDEPQPSTSTSLNPG